VLYGRDAERARIGELLEAARESRSGALVVRGEAGIGKSALLDDAREQAAGMHVLTARGVESESELPFAALHQLLRPALRQVYELPPPQRKALSGALGLGERSGEDRFLVSLAVLTLLAEFAEQRPMLALIDDAHWLDEPSADALLFVARRLDADGIALLFAVREDEDTRFDSRDLPVLELEGLPVEACESLLSQNAPANVAPHVRDQLVRHTGGNALALLELPAALSEEQLAGADPLPAALPLTEGVERVFLERVRRLPEPTQRLLLVAAADDTGSLPTVMHAAEALGANSDALDLAEQSGLVLVHGSQIDLRHPLVRSAVYHGAPSSDRRAAHQALADALAVDENADRRVWHLAAATLEPDEDIAAALEQAARSARDRTGYAAASSALVRAASLTPGEEMRYRRLHQAADASWQAGRSEQALSLLDQALAGAQEPDLRANMLHLVGHIQHFTGPSMPAHDLLLDAAKLVEEINPANAAAILTDAFEAALYAGEARAALAAARRARELAPTDHVEANYLAELNLAEALFMNGLADEGAPMFEHAFELFQASEELQSSPRLTTRAAIALCWLERCEEGHKVAVDAINLARERGAVARLPYGLFIVAWAARRIGAWQEAVAAATEGATLARELGQRATMAQCLQELSTLTAARGSEDECRRYMNEGVEVAESLGARYVTEVIRAQAGILELGLGRLDAAAAELQASGDRLDELGLRIHELSPGPDLVETLTRAGRLEEARAALELVRTGTNLRTAASILARCRGLVAAEGEFEQHFVESLATHPEGEDVFGKARTQLCFGERLRRAKRRVEARDQLRAALETFEHLGAAPWAERARTELRASGETARKRDPSTVTELTPQELQVARYVAEGLSNKEVAAQLFVSPRTIDAHLRSVFAKLEITSRTQLARLPLDDLG
jgi:DNA-binding CsgD family transcriptional regulator